MNFNAVDISYCQTITDGAKLKETVKFCVIRASQGKNRDGTGSFYADRNFLEHTKICIKNKIPFGFYHFFCAANAKEAKEEAEKFVKLISPYKKYVSYVFLDCENYENKPLLSQSKEQLTESCKAFCDYCGNAGYIPVLYTNEDHLKYRLDANRIGRQIWIAKYGYVKPNISNVIMWQFGSGKVNGIKQYTDKNECYIPKAHLSVMSLALKGFIVNPVYWCKELDLYKNEHYGKLLENLVIDADNAFAYRWKQSLVLKWALSYLKKSGVVQDTEYAERVSMVNANVKSLILKLGGGVKK